MRILFTKHAEKQRQDANRERRAKWEYFVSSNAVEALHKARDMGWGDDKVQVRRNIVAGEEQFTIEPYEPGCGCRGLLRYGDFFN